MEEKMASSLNLQYAIPVLLPLSIFLLVLLKNKLSSSTKKNKSSPPSPPKLPIIGNLHQIFMSPHQGLRSLSQKYGDLMLVHLGSVPVVIASSVETACKIMKTHDLAFCSRPQWKFVVRFLNNGKDVIAAPYGDYWRNMRKICVNQLLSKKRVDSFLQIREEEVNLMVDKIKGMILSSTTTSSAAVDMRLIFTSLNTDIVSRAVLGRKLNDNPDEAGYDIDVNKLVEQASDLVAGFAIGEFAPCLAWTDWITRATAGIDKLVKTFDEFFDKVIVDRHSDEGRGKGNKDLQGCVAKDFVDILLDFNKSGSTNGYMPLDNESIRGLLLDMFLGGIETSSTALEWMMSELLRSPRVMDKLQEEVATFAKGNGVIIEEDLKSMVYLKATIKETLRLHPPIPLLVPREAVHDVEINGYDIVAGSMVFVNAWAIGRDPRQWEEPDQFRPERFLNPLSEVHTYEFNMVPFGSGRRRCPGELFGTTIMELAMANLLLQFNWRLPFGIDRETFDMKEGPGPASHKLIPLLAVAMPRVL